MPVYYCKVVDEKGKTAEFVRETVSEEILIRELSADRLFPLAIEEAGMRGRRVTGRRKYPRNQIIEFTDTLALLLSSGLIFKEALEIARSIYTRGRMNSLTVLLLEKIKKGVSFHDALGDFGDSFPAIYRGMVKVGEKVGSLENAFRGLSLYLSEEKKLREKLVGSMMYPAMVLSVAFAGFVILVTFILPRIRGIFTQLGAAVPQRIQSISNLMSVLTFGLIAGIGVLCILAVRFFFVRRSGGRMARVIDQAVLKLPVIGRIKSLRENLNFLFAMETLTGAGFSVEDALEEAENVVNNLALREGIARAREDILRGDALSDAFTRSPVFPDRLCRWIHIGEKSGNIEKAFSQLRNYYQGEVEKWSSRFMNLVEPVLILCVGGVIFLFVVFFVIPIFTIYGNL
jgi:type IV pilus assembly protein PilC